MRWSEPGDRRGAIVTAALTAGVCLRSLGLVALALVSRRVLDQGTHIPAFLALALAIPLLGTLLSWSAGRETDRAAASYRHLLLERLLHKDSEACAPFHSGAVFSRITGDVYTLCDWSVSQRPELLGQLVRLCAALWALFLVSRPLGAAVLLLGGAVLAVGVGYRRLLKPWHHRVLEADEALTAIMQEILEHLEFLRAATAVGETVRRFDRRQRHWRRRQDQLRLRSLAGSAGLGLLGQLAFCGLTVWGGLSIRDGRITFGDLAALLQLAGLVQGPLTGLSAVQARLAGIHAARERLWQLLELAEEPAEREDLSGVTCRAVVFENVTFCYRGEETPVLQNFSARLPLDRWTFLTGESGSGKSTLLRLILGLYHPQAGRVYVESDRGDLPCTAAIRPLFGFVPQEPWLFAGTVRENLLLANPEADDAAVWQALDQACCGFLRELPQGLDTCLAEGGGGLSVGQRQRIAVARALLAGARVLLLDEITSALDEPTEERLLAELARACPGAVMATHHRRAVERMDGVCVHLEGAGRSPAGAPGDGEKPL